VRFATWRRRTTVSICAEASTRSPRWMPTATSATRFFARKALTTFGAKKLFATTDPSRAALTPLNYELNAAEPAEPGVVRLLAKPRRREISLVDGSVFVTTEDADLVRVEGRLAKNPSFWTTRVDVVRRYERRSGIRVPVRLDTTAQIRVAGASTMSVVYDYEMVNGVSFK
jgi:hypothetical protein